MFRLKWDEIDQVLWCKKSTLKNNVDGNTSLWSQNATLNKRGYKIGTIYKLSDTFLLDNVIKESIIL